MLVLTFACIAAAGRWGQSLEGAAETGGRGSDSMTNTHSSLKAVALGLCLAAGSALPATAQTAKAQLKDAQGKDAGTATLTQTPAGVLIALAVKGVPPGEHAFHVHAVGKCEPPFTSAGGHFNPGTKKHGLMAAEGHHAGDMPNLHIPASGELTVEVLNDAVTLEKGKPNSLFGPDGTALVIHAGKDDYRTDPAGDAGGRIVCGVVQQ
jgi:Cu-Zn family superoxide dismutase